MMKKWILIMAALLLLLSIPARAAQPQRELLEALPPSAGELLDGMDFSAAGGIAKPLETLLRRVGTQVTDIVRQRTQGVARILLAVVLCSMAEGIYRGLDGGRPAAFIAMAGVLSVTLLTAGSLDSLMGLGAATIGQLSDFSKALLPTLATACAASGGAVSASVHQVATVFFVDLLLNLINNLLMPALYLYVGMLAAASCFPKSHLGGLAELLKKAIVWLLTGTLLLFTVYLSAAGVFSGVADQSAVRVAKAAVSGALPVVGGIVAEASEAVLAGAGILRGSIGLIGVLGILAACACPFLHLGVQFLLYKLTAWLALTVGSEELCKLIDGLGGAFGLVLGMTGSCALLLLISVLASVSVVLP